MWRKSSNRLDRADRAYSYCYDQGRYVWIYRTQFLISTSVLGLPGLQEWLPGTAVCPRLQCPLKLPLARCIYTAVTSRRGYPMGQASFFTSAPTRFGRVDTPFGVVYRYLFLGLLTKVATVPHRHTDLFARRLGICRPSRAPVQTSSSVCLPKAMKILGSGGHSISGSSVRQ